MRYSLLLAICLVALGCSAADEAANEATQATLGSADLANEVVGQGTAKVKEDQKTADDSEAK